MKNDFEHIDEAVLGAYLSGNISDEGRNAVELWLLQSDSNKETLDALRKIWEAAESEKQTFPIFDTDAAWKRMQAKMNETEQHVDRSEKIAQRKPFPFLRIAASILVLASLSWFAYMLLHKPEMITIVASNDEVIYLPDSTEVLLQKGSKLSYQAEFSKSERRSNLEGKALFKVRKELNRPFFVEAGTAELRVLGTEFWVFSGNDSSSVLLKEGSVQVSLQANKKQSVILKPGMQAITKTLQDEIEVKDGIEVQGSLFKLEKKLVFQQTELSAVLKMLSELFNTEINIEINHIDNCYLTASFNDQSLEEIIEVIASTFNLELNKQNKTYLLRGEGC